MEQLYPDKKHCFGCGACAAACPAGAVSMNLDSEGFPYPVLDRARCLDCGKCGEVCPAQHPAPRKESFFYAVRCRDGELLNKSSSGGAFSLLAREVTAQDGLVCGAVFDRDFSVRHVLSRDIAPMRKSKYVQSDLGNSFRDVQTALEAGRQVLFSGTPCQCRALERFLGGRPDGLLLAALVCRGVQSPGLWADHVAWLGQGAPVEAYDFRDKRLPNDGHTVAYTVGGQETAVPMAADRFSQLYLRGLTLRPSCYACPYCSPELGPDFSLGDFWGIGREHPELDDGRGVSLVIARGARARAMVERMAETAVVIPCPQGTALQPALTAPAQEPMLRRFLFRDFARKGTDGRCDVPFLLKKYCVG